jgi:hypothetical protein
MNDLATVAIALISAGAALGGTLIQDVLRKRAQNEVNERADKELLRTKLEQIFSEIDRIENQSAKLAAQYLLDLQQGRSRDAVEDQIALGTIRSYVAVYFPSCAPCLLKFDEEKRQRMASFASLVTQPDANVKLATIEFTVDVTRGYGKLAEELRKALVLEAARLAPEGKKS